MSDGGDARRLFETHSHAWREVGLARQLSRRAVKRARIQAAVFVPLLAAILVVYGYRDDLFGSAYDRPVRIVTAIALCVARLAGGEGRGRDLFASEFEEGT